LPQERQRRPAPRQRPRERPAPDRIPHPVGHVEQRRIPRDPQHLPLSSRGGGRGEGHAPPHFSISGNPNRTASPISSNANSARTTQAIAAFHAAALAARHAASSSRSSSMSFSAPSSPSPIRF